MDMLGIAVCDGWHETIWTALMSTSQSRLGRQVVSCAPQIRHVGSQTRGLSKMPFLPANVGPKVLRDPQEVEKIFVTKISQKITFYLQKCL